MRSRFPWEVVVFVLLLALAGGVERGAWPF